MADIFQAYDRDSSEPSVHYEVMTKRGSFWYHSGAFTDEQEARRVLAALVAEPDCAGALIDRVTRELLEKREQS